MTDQLSLEQAAEILGGEVVDVRPLEPEKPPTPDPAPPAENASTGEQGVVSQGPAPDPKFGTVRALLERLRPNMEAVLPKHLTVDRMIKVALVCCSKTPRLLECTPASMAAAMMQAAELGLEPGGALKHGHLVPFKNARSGRLEAVFIPGYQGLIALARRSGAIAQIGAWPVFKDDVWEYANTEKGQTFSHVPNWESENQKPPDVRLVYAVARLKDEPLPQVEVMTRGAVELIRAKSRAGNDGPWITDWIPMARKTVIKQLCKFLPLSPELAKAIEIDNEVETGAAFKLSAMPEEPLSSPIETEASVSGKTKTQRVKEKLKAS